MKARDIIEDYERRKRNFEKHFYPFDPNKVIVVMGQFTFNDLRASPLHWCLTKDDGGNYLMGSRIVFARDSSAFHVTYEL